MISALSWGKPGRVFPWAMYSIVLLPRVAKIPPGFPLDRPDSWALVSTLAANRTVPRHGYNRTFHRINHLQVGRPG